MNHRETALRLIRQVLTEGSRRPIIPIVDPDKCTAQVLRRVGEVLDLAQDSRRRVVLVGGSYLHDGDTARVTRQLRRRFEGANLWGILGGAGAAASVVREMSLMLLSVVPGAMSPLFVFDEHLRAYPIIKRHGMAAASVGYLHLDVHSHSTAAFLQQARLIPVADPAFVAAIAKTCEILGSVAVYLEAGSGGRLTVPEEVIRAVTAEVTIPVLVGGGIRSADAIRRVLASGSSAVVLGRALEDMPEEEWRDLRVAFGEPPKR